MRIIIRMKDGDTRTIDGRNLDIRILNEARLIQVFDTHTQHTRLVLDRTLIDQIEFQGKPRPPKKAKPTQTSIEQLQIKVDASDFLAELQKAIESVKPEGMTLEEIQTELAALRQGAAQDQKHALEKIEALERSHQFLDNRLSEACDRIADMEAAGQATTVAINDHTAELERRIEAETASRAELDLEAMAPKDPGHAMDSIVAEAGGWEPASPVDLTEVMMHQRRDKKNRKSPCAHCGGHRRHYATCTLLPPELAKAMEAENEVQPGDCAAE